MAKILSSVGGLYSSLHHIIERVHHYEKFLPTVEAVHNSFLNIRPYLYLGPYDGCSTVNTQPRLPRLYKFPVLVEDDQILARARLSGSRNLYQVP